MPSSNIPDVGFGPLTLLSGWIRGSLRITIPVLVLAGLVAITFFVLSDDSEPTIEEHSLSEQITAPSAAPNKTIWNSFRDIRLGANVNDYPKLESRDDLWLLGEGHIAAKRYQNPSDKLEIGNIPLASIEYVAYDDHFVEVNALTSALGPGSSPSMHKQQANEFEALYEILCKRYGEPENIARSEPIPSINRTASWHSPDRQYRATLGEERDRFGFKVLC